MSEKIEFGSLVIEVVKKHFYCRYCREYNSYCRARHRSGIFFLIKVHNTRNGRSTLALIGEGETENNRIIDWNRAYITSAGWLSPILRTPEDFIWQEEYLGEGWEEVRELTQHERDALYSLLLSESIEQPEGDNLYTTPQGLHLLCALLEKGIIDLKDDIGALSVFKPMLAVYVKGGTVTMPLGAQILLIPNSWAAEFSWGDIRFKIPKLGKVRYSLCSRYYGARQYANLSLPKGKELWWAERNGRKIVYYMHNPPEFSEGWHSWGEMYGNEQYGDHLHMPARIAVATNAYIEDLITLLIDNRLGDLVFVPADMLTIAKEYRLTPAREWQFNKIEVMRGTTIEYGDPIIARSETKLRLYHPEHGLLELPPGEYVVLTPPYLHDAHAD